MTAIPSYLPLRNDLIGEEPYGAPQLDLPICLNVNENPYEVAPEVIETIVQRVREVAPTLNRYPDREHIALRKALAEYLQYESHVDLDVEQLWAANGSNEIMLQLFQAFGGPGRIALGFAPTYSMYPEYARDTFTQWEVGQRNEDFTLDVASAVEQIRAIRPAMVILTSPNNPTGTPLSIDDLRTILDAVQTVTVQGADEQAHPVVVVDEAYVEFRDPSTDSATTLIGQYNNLAVSRTMSKAFAYAGVRLGYVAAHSGIIDSLRIVRLPYHLSAVTQAVALAALEHRETQLQQVAHLRELREETAVWLRSLQYHGKPIQVADSDSNFVLFGEFDDTQTIFEQLIERGCLIRVVGPRGWMRVSMGTDEEMATFRTAFEEILATLD